MLLCLSALQPPFQFHDLSYLFNQRLPIARGYVNQAEATLAPDHAPSPVGLAYGVDGAVGIPPGCIQLRVATHNYTLVDIGAVHPSFCNGFEGIAATFPAEQRGMLGAEELGYGFDVDQCLVA